MIFLPPRLRRDWRVPRDWRRPWRDRPGMICCCTPAVICSNCATIQFTDGFTSNLAGYTAHHCTGGPPSAETWNATGGFLTESHQTSGSYDGGGNYTQSIARPSLSGLCISVCAQIYLITGKTTGVTGVTIGNSGMAFVQAVGGQKGHTMYYGDGTGSATDVNGCLSGNGSVTGDIAAWSDGDAITLKIEDTSGGAGTYKQTMYMNGVQLFQKTGIAYTLPNPIKIGMYDTDGGKWANLKIATS